MSISIVAYALYHVYSTYMYALLLLHECKTQ